MSTSRLENKVAVVTGSGHGIGKAYARRLAQDGAAVIIAELDAQAARATAEELSAAGLRALAAPTDVADKNACLAMAKAAVDAYGRIDILVNNAAMFSTVPMSRVPFDQIDPAEWDRMMAINLRGIWYACQAVVPHMRANRYGKIVNISSSTVFERTGTRIHYVTSKAGVIGFTRTLAAELGADGICVNCVAPGSTLSEENPDPSTVRFRGAAAERRALARTQTPEDLVGAIAFFSSPDSDFITGQTLVVDGGSIFH